MADITLPSSGAAGKAPVRDCQSMVIVGANGSGKSRLGIWIEDKHDNAHRISAQRSLVFTEQIQPRPTTVAQTYLLYGSYHQSPRWDEEVAIEHARKSKHSSRWGSRPESHLLNDFDHLLSLLLALQHRRNEKFVEDCERGRIDRSSLPPQSALDRVLAVWHRVMPHRGLAMTDSRLVAARRDLTDSYSGLAMSDGERVAFYLIGQAMCAPGSSIVIVDEPEVHLHKAIQASLWDAIEAERSDCTFIYVTHDLEFAASRSRADIVWVRDFDGVKWSWETVDQVDGFPRDLTLEILGSRKPVLFVEGTRDSIDTLLYRRIYPDFHIVAREGCGKVIESTRALRCAEGFHSANAMGVIDRDYRSDTVIAALEGNGVYATPVAEAENVICLPCVVQAAARHLRKDAATTLQNVTDAAFEFLKHQLDHQIKERASQEIRHALSQFSSKGIGNQAEFEQAAVDFKNAVDPGAFYGVALQEFQTVIDDQDYEGLLRLFNNKGLEDAVAKAIGFKDGAALRDWVIAEIDDSLKAEKPSQIGVELLQNLKQVFPAIPRPPAPTPASPEGSGEAEADNG